MYTWDVVWADMAVKKRDALIAFVAATAKGCRWAMEHPAEAGAISRKVLPDLPTGEAEYAAADFARKKFWHPTGLPAHETWNFTVATLVKLGNIKQPIKYDDIVLADFVNAAAKG